jgi:hypothetical protein
MKIFCVAWKTEVMPVFAYWYYHEGCYDPYAHQRFGKEIEVREVAVADLLGHADCCGCHESLNSGEIEEVVA